SAWNLMQVPAPAQVGTRQKDPLPQASGCATSQAPAARVPEDEEEVPAPPMPPCPEDPPAALAPPEPAVKGWMQPASAPTLPRIAPETTMNPDRFFMIHPPHARLGTRGKPDPLGSSGLGRG